MRHTPHLFECNLTSTLADHFRKWSSRYKRIDDVAVQSVRKSSQLAKGDALVGF